MFEIFFITLIIMNVELEFKQIMKIWENTIFRKSEIFRKFLGYIFSSNKSTHLLSSHELGLINLNCV